VHFFDADGLAGKDRAEIDFLSAETNAATVCDDDGAVKRVVDVRQYGVPSRRRLTNLCRTFHVKASCGRSFLKTSMKSSKRTCCAPLTKT
jgi:hypothetical protein